MSMNRYAYHYAKMNHTAIMLNEKIDPTFLHKATNTLPSVISTSLVIAMYGPETNMSLKCHIYVTYAN